MYIDIHKLSEHIFFKMMILKNYDSNIHSKEQVRDLGIMMGNTPTFTNHIRKVVKARDKMRLVLRVFQS